MSMQRDALLLDLGPGQRRARNGSRAKAKATLPQVDRLLEQVSERCRQFAWLKCGGFGALDEEPAQLGPTCVPTHVQS